MNDVFVRFFSLKNKTDIRTKCSVEHDIVKRDLTLLGAERHGGSPPSTDHRTAW